MPYRRISFVLVLFAMLTIGCKKHSSGSLCETLREGMIANNPEQVKSAITLLINKLPSKLYTESNLNLLASLLSGQCTVTANVFCFDCIKTLPSQTEIRLSFTSSGSTVTKTIDISYSPDNKMTVVSMHE
jgi:hypothetical protein